MSFVDGDASVSDITDVITTTQDEAITTIQDQNNETTSHENQQTAQKTASLAKYRQDLSDLRQNTLSEGDIYDDELIERYGEKWEAQFSSTKEFRDMMYALREYTLMDVQDDTGWNKEMVVMHTKIHNFDTIIEKTGFGHEIVSLVVAKQKLLGLYNHTEPVEKFHDWLNQKYPAPDSITEIDQRLAEIISEPGFIVFAPNLADAFNTLAAHGNVPTELFETDSKYWNLIVSIASCEYSPGCNVASLEEILADKTYERDPGPPPDVASDWLSLFLPSAFAWSETYHFTIIYGEPHTCTYGTCKVQITVPWNLGEHKELVSPPITNPREGSGHGTSNYMNIYVYTCSNPNAYNYATAKLESGSPTRYFAASGMGCAEIDMSVLASDRTSPWYVWYLEGKTNSWMP